MIIANLRKKCEQIVHPFKYFKFKDLSQFTQTALYSSTTRELQILKDVANEEELIIIEQYENQLAKLMNK